MRRPFLLRVCLLAAWQPATGHVALRQPVAQEKHSDSGLVAVRYCEGTVHGFLELRTESDSLIAHGDLLQVPTDSGLESRMILHFRDNSYFEETTRYTQHQVFRLQSYRLVQRGPSFSQDLDAGFSIGGAYQVRSVSHEDGKESRYDGKLELPADTYNGLPVVVTRNLRPGDTTLVHLVAFTPKPRVIGLEISFVAASHVVLGERAEETAHFRLTPKLGAFTAFFAKLLGKLPPDSHIWVVTEQVPAFIHFKGPLYTGPSWQLSLTTPTWPKRPPAD